MPLKVSLRQFIMTSLLSVELLTLHTMMQEQNKNKTVYISQKDSLSLTAAFQMCGRCLMSVSDKASGFHLLTLQLQIH